MCPPGTNASSMGLFDLSSCEPCPAGYYCPHSGTAIATQRCPGGHYCAAGTASLGNSTICPAGSKCPTGSYAPIACPGGTYQSMTKSADCLPCPAGFECSVGSKYYTVVCPVNKYCPEGSEVGTVCRNGTYGNATRQTSASDCTECPGGKYCNQGFILGNCSTGYFCKSGQHAPSPYVDVSRYSDSVALLRYLQTINGGPCYPGYYCPEGSAEPTSCFNGTVRAEPYGESQEDCGACPLGFLCLVGNPVPVKCSVGHYCPKNSAEIPCPVGTVNPLASQFSLDNCTSCPAGYFCNSTGLSSYKTFHCPSGHYCVERATTAFPCAGGTYRDRVGGIAQDDCDACPGGHFCRSGSSSFEACAEGTYCPVGSEAPTVCPPGHYCPSKSTAPTTCPATYYCPAGAHAPTPCYLGTYCPASTAYPIPCPLGYKAVANTNDTHAVLSSLSSACEECPPGYYGTDPARRECTLGQAGYYYLGAATSATPANITLQRGAVCPSGVN
jgi:hypothetical protein